MHTSSRNPWRRSETKSPGYPGLFHPESVKSAIKPSKASKTHLPGLAPGPVSRARSASSPVANKALGPNGADVAATCRGRHGVVRSRPPRTAFPATGAHTRNCPRRRARPAGHCDLVPSSPCPSRRRAANEWPQASSRGRHRPLPFRTALVRRGASRRGRRARRCTAGGCAPRPDEIARDVAPGRGGRKTVRSVSTDRPDGDIARLQTRARAGPLRRRGTPATPRGTAASPLMDAAGRCAHRTPGRQPRGRQARHPRDPGALPPPVRNAAPEDMSLRRATAGSPRSACAMRSGVARDGDRCGISRFAGRRSGAQGCGRSFTSPAPAALARPSPAPAADNPDGRSRRRG